MAAAEARKWRRVIMAQSTFGDRRGAIGRRQFRRLLQHSIRIEWRCRRGPAILLGAHLIDFAANPSFVRFQNFADALVEFNAVAIEWNMAAAHHHARPFGANGARNKRGSGNLAGVFDLVARVDNRLRASTHDAVRARPQIARDDNAVADANVADA
jgi:hypothetical protein